MRDGEMERMQDETRHAGMIWRTLATAAVLCLLAAIAGMLLG